MILRKGVLRLPESGENTLTEFQYDQGAYLFLPSYVIRTHGIKQQRETVKRTPRKQLELVFEALDTLGNTKWRINRRILGVVDRLWLMEAVLQTWLTVKMLVHAKYLNLSAAIRFDAGLFSFFFTLAHNLDYHIPISMPENVFSMDVKHRPKSPNNLAIKIKLLTLYCMFQSSVFHSQPKSIIGAPAYIAPEVCLGNNMMGR
ncbi:hypothetical protein ERO13_A03G092501v2 [Gossypium hirsutum]|nr:hypothetical protein ERO13_A03G092501v2 [Gossypium hirsutum]